MVSLIIPCFNVSEIKLNRMMNSIASQTYSQLQVLLIDDGSTNNTLSTLHKWKNNFTSIGFECKVFTKQNGGMASAINIGLKHFTGKYVCFPDSDDAVEPDYVSSMLTYLECNPLCNIVRCNFTMVTEMGSTRDLYVVEQNFYEHGYLKTVLLKQESTNVWPMLVRADFLRKRIPRLHLHEGGPLASQEWQLLLPLTYRNNVALLNKSLYNYYIYPNSHARSHMANQTSALKYNAKIKEVLLTTLDTMQLDPLMHEQFVDVSEFHVARLNMSITDVNETIKYSCASTMACLLKKYMSSNINVDTLMLQKRFSYHAYRLQNVLLEINI